MPRCATPAATPAATPKSVRNPARRCIPGATLIAQLALTVAAALALAAMQPAVAQNRPQNLEALPDVPPPPPASLQLSPGQEPEVRIIQRDREKIEEFRMNGQLYMIRVTPPGGVPYYLVDHFGDGNFARTATYDSGVRVPMWVIRSW